MKDLNLNEVNNVAGGTYAFCSLKGQSLICTHAYYNGYENVLVGNPQIVDGVHYDKHGVAWFYV